jgi:outer membrane lipoprotein
MLRIIIAITTLGALALAGCATIPAPVAGTDFAALTPQQAVAQNAASARVRWGGEIIKVEPKNDATCFEVLSRDLYPDSRPNRHDRNDGRFIACSKGFYDPAIYTRGRDLTITGKVAGTEQHQVGDYNYTYAHVDAEGVYLWPKREYARYAPYPYFGDPLFGPYPGWYGWWGPPEVVIVRHH